MDTMQTIDVILAIKDLKAKAKQKKQEAIETLSEAEGALSAASFLEEQFSMQIEMYSKSRNVD